jgi:pyruvate/2-oxoglutarate/acetoin dehydrogenase E1 component
MPEVAVRELTMGEAVREALSEEMRRDPSVFIMGEDVAEAGTPFKVLSGMVEEFGKSRVIDTPISEPGFTGIGVGAAMTGLRPVVDIMFGDFLTLVMDQLVNQAAFLQQLQCAIHRNAVELGIFSLGHLIQTLGVQMQAGVVDQFEQYLS